MTTPRDIVERLRFDLLEGRIAPGAELRQEELARRFGVSRMPVRDALSILAADGLVQLRPNRGAQVVVLSRNEIGEAYDLRILLEMDCLRHAAASYQPIEIDHARRICDLAAGRPDQAEADRRFHHTLYAPSGRMRQLSIVMELRDICQLHLAAYADLRQASDRCAADHRAIVLRLNDGDTTGACNALQAHLIDARDMLLERMADIR